MATNKRVGAAVPAGHRLKVHGVGLSATNSRDIRTGNAKAPLSSAPRQPPQPKLLPPSEPPLFRSYP